MISYAEFSKIKDNYCICYFGYCDEYLVQLRLLKKLMEKRFKGLNISFGCKDDKVHFLKDCPVIKVTELKMKKKEFAHVKELRSTGNNHPVEELLESSGMQHLIVCSTSETPTTKCLIVTKGTMPTRSLDENTIQMLERRARDNGFEPVRDEKTVSDAGWVMGVESPELFEAAGRGIKTTLVDTGIGTRLYKNMFPNGEVLHR